MKISIIVLITILRFTTYSFGQSGKLSGHWKIDRSASSFGRVTTHQFSIPLSYDITIQRSRIRIVRGVETAQGIIKPDTLEFTVNGKPFENFSASHKRQNSTLHLSPDGNGFAVTIDSFTDDGKPYLHITETFRSTADKMMLVTRRVNQIQNGVTYDIKGVFEKK